MNIILFENFSKRKLYRGISKQELIKSCDNGNLLYRSADGRVSLTPDIEIAKDHSNYVVEVGCDAEQIGESEFKADDPEDCSITLIHEFDTSGNEIGTYTLDEFSKIS